VSAFSVTVQVKVLELVHPVHEEKALLPEVAGAPSVTVVPAM
jgi:heme exporter protein D